jgi:hypothetical protein
MEETIRGQMLRRNARWEVAIYLRGGVLCVADFDGDDKQIVDAPTWIRFHCELPTTRDAQRRMAFESAVPVSRELSMRIGRLHRARDAAIGQEDER